jgi:hypothetical protein
MKQTRRSACANMKKIRILVPLIACSVMQAGFAAPKTASSLSQVPELIQSKEGLQNYSYQMGGAPKPDGFGTVLPEGLNAKQIVDLVAPGRDPSLATLVGAKPWPYHSGWYVTVACFARNKAEHDSDMRYSGNKPSCSKYYDGNGYYDKAMYLGVIEFKPGEKAQLVASYGKPLDVRTSWKYSALEGPQGKFDVPGSDEADLLPEEYVRFDFAPYKLSDSDTAFGLRLGWNDGYAGGTGYFEALSLFRIEGSKLSNVLSEPIYYYLDLAGAWNKDGTRNHEFHEGQNVLSVLQRKTQGFHDLQIKTTGKKTKRLFLWDEAKQRYLPAGSPVKRTN